MSEPETYQMFDTTSAALDPILSGLSEEQIEELSEVTFYAITFITYREVDDDLFTTPPAPMVKAAKLMALEIYHETFSGLVGSASIGDESVSWRVPTHFSSMVMLLLGRYMTDPIPTANACRTRAQKELRENIGNRTFGFTLRD